MADKFRVTFPIPVTMGRGEQPTADKLNSISTQAKNGLALVERAVGDVWTQSGDSLMGGEPLQVATLARVLGQQLYNNAVFQKPDLGVSETIQVNQSIIAQRGQSELRLDLLPEDDSTLATELDNAGYPNQVLNREDIADDDEWFVDQTTGIIYLGAPFPLDDAPTKNEIEYNVLAANWPTDGSSESAYNVIPHPEMEDDWRGLKFVSRDTNKYLIYLPPRRPLKLNASEIGKIPREPNNSVTPAASPTHRYWYVNSSNWSSPADITADADHLAVAVSRRYRHKLPELIYDLVTTGGLGTTIPSGSIFLWDNTNNTIVEGLTFKVPETDVSYGGSLRPGWVIQVEGAILDNLLTGGTDYTSTLITDDPADYKQRFSLITVGEGAAEKSNALSTELIDESNLLGIQPRLAHSALSTVNPVARGGSDTYAAPPATYRDGDDHSYLLSREGSTSDSNTIRDRYNNAILGDLLMAAVSGTTRQGTTVNSQAIAFGDVTSGPRVSFTKGTGATVRDSSGVLASNGDALGVSNHPLLVDSKIVYFDSSSNSDGLTFDDGENIFRFFADNSVSSAALVGGEFMAIGTSYDVGTVQTAYKGTDLARWVRMFSTGTRNKIEFRGDGLDLSAFTGDTNNVEIGTENTSTNLDVVNGVIYFGSTLNNLTYTGSIFTLNSSGTTRVDSAGNFLSALGKYYFRTTSTKLDVFEAPGGLYGSGDLFFIQSTAGSSTAGTTAFRAGLLSSDRAIPVSSGDVAAGADIVLVENSASEHAWKYHEDGYFFGGRAENSGSGNEVTPLVANPLWTIGSGDVDQIKFGPVGTNTIEHDDSPGDGDVDKFIAYENGSSALSSFQAGTFIAVGTNEVLRPNTTGGSTQYWECQYFCYPAGVKFGENASNRLGLPAWESSPLPGTERWLIYPVTNIAAGTGQITEVEVKAIRTDGTATTLAVNLQTIDGTDVLDETFTVAATVTTDSWSAPGDFTATSLGDSGHFVVIRVTEAGGTDWATHHVKVKIRYADAVRAAGWTGTLVTA